MTVAVLKNRLLNITDRTFDEARWGATNMRDFVSALDRVVTVDTSWPTTVHLNEGVEVGAFEAVAAAEPARRRGDWSVRADLWEAVIDCVSGDVYVWEEGSVRAHPEDDVPSAFPILPTVTSAELAGWRDAFAEEAGAATDGETRAQLEHWRSTGTSSQSLPPRYRNQWYGVLKRHVRARLEEWFATHSIEPPADWIVATTNAVEKPDNDTEHLRAVMLRAVRLMTRDELDGLTLPISVVGRLLR